MLSRRVYYDFEKFDESMVTVNIDPHKARRICDIIVYDIRNRFYEKVANYIKRYNKMFMPAIYSINLTRSFWKNFTNEEIHAIIDNYKRFVEHDKSLIQQNNLRGAIRHCDHIFERYAKAAFIKDIPKIMKVLLMRTQLQDCTDIQVYVNEDEVFDKIDDVSILYDTFFSVYKNGIKGMINHVMSILKILSHAHVEDMNDIMTELFNYNTDRYSIYKFIYNFFSADMNAIQCITCTLFGQKNIITPIGVNIERDVTQRYKDQDQKAQIRVRNHNRDASDWQPASGAEVVHLFSIVNKSTPFTAFNMHDELLFSDCKYTSEECDRLQNELKNASSIVDIPSIKTLNSLFDAYVTHRIFDHIVSKEWSTIALDVMSNFNLEEFEIERAFFNLMQHDYTMQYNPDSQYFKLFTLSYAYVVFNVRVTGYYNTEPYYALYPFNGSAGYSLDSILVNTVEINRDRCRNDVDRYLVNIAKFIWHRVFGPHYNEINNCVLDEMRVINSNILRKNPVISFDGNIEKFSTELKYYYGRDLTDKNTIILGG